MKKLVENLVSEVNTFVEQRNNLVMLLACTDNEVGLVMKIIEDIEKVSPSDAYFFFTDDFIELEPYVGVIIERLSQQRKIANEEANKENLEHHIAPIPEKLKGHELPAIQRMGQAMVYTRSLVPSVGVHNVIWVISPQTISNREAYHQLVASFSPKGGISDGMQGVRIIFRDLPDSQKKSPYLADLSRIQFNQIDMGSEAIQVSLEETIEDESLSDEERVSALLQNAMIDSAHGRTDSAYEHFKYLLGYYQYTKNHALQAVVINAVGDIYRQKNEFDKAIHVYETAISPAVESKSAAVLNNVVINLANTEFDGGNFSLAEQYYGQVDQLSSKMLYADGKISALNRQAECAIQQDSWERAIQIWEKTADFCRHSEFEEELIEQLEKLVGAEHLVAEKKEMYEEELNSLQTLDS